jgi:endoglucanase
MNKKLTDTALRIAERDGIAHQIAVEPGGDSGTNTRVIQLSREGVATALLGIPLKYMHTPRETVHTDDLEAAAKLLCELIKTLGGGEGNA